MDGWMDGPLSFHGLCHEVVLVGDSGERDPIICAELLRQPFGSSGVTIWWRAGGCD